MTIPRYTTMAEQRALDEREAERRRFAAMAMTAFLRQDRSRPADVIASDAVEHAEALQKLLDMTAPKCSHPIERRGVVKTSSDGERVYTIPVCLDCNAEGPNAFPK